MPKSQTGRIWDRWTHIRAMGRDHQKYRVWNGAHLQTSIWHHKLCYIEQHQNAVRLPSWYIICILYTRQFRRMSLHLLRDIKANSHTHTHTERERISRRDGHHVTRLYIFPYCAIFIALAYNIFLSFFLYILGFLLFAFDMRRITASWLTRLLSSCTNNETSLRSVPQWRR